MKRIKWQIEIGEGEPVPKYYGVAWYEPWRLGTVCYPIPVNIIAAACRHIWMWLSFFATSGWSNPIEKAERRGYFKAMQQKDSN